MTTAAPPLPPAPAPARPHDLSVEAARQAIAAAIDAARPPPLEVERRPLAQALGRVLAADLVSPIDVPAHDNSAMDGYALRGTELPATGARRWPVRRTVLAGDTPGTAPLPTGCAARIMTGAVLPAGFDTVVPQELCRTGQDAAGAWVEVDAGTVRPGDHRRRRGEDLPRGGLALAAGRRLRPADLGLAASLGLDTLGLRRPLRVAVFSTGNELREAGQALEPGCIYDSNRPALLAALRRLGLEAIDLGRVGDDPAALRATFARAVEVAEVVITSGGVSQGDADHTRALLAELGEVGFWSVAMRPGRPFAFGTLRAPHDGAAPRWLFALPGNPVAALVSFCVLVREPLLRLAGSSPEPLPRLSLPCATALRKRPGRAEFPRGRLEPGADGRWQVRPSDDQGSGQLHSLSEAHALILLEAARGPVAAGEAVEIWLCDGLV